MNIFILDGEIDKCVQYYMDKHVVKQILEHVQMMMGAYYYCKYYSWHMAKLKSEGLYKLAYKNHPCTIWTRTSINNFQYLLDLTKALEEERKYRFGSDKTHKGLEKLTAIINKHGRPALPYIEQTPFCICMPICWQTWKEKILNETDKIILDPVLSYRKYYQMEKRHLAKWTNRPVPPWYS